MSENCTHDCSTCSSACASRTAPQDLLEKPNDMTHVKKLIGVVSGKGGVGKSLVTSMLAVLMQPSGLHRSRSGCGYDWPLHPPVPSACTSRRRAPISASCPSLPKPVSG